MSGGDESRVTSDQDATMTDIGEKGRSPGDPPDGMGSWVTKVTGTNVGGRPVPETLLTEEFVSARLNVSFPNGEDGEPVISIGEEVLEAMNDLWKQCMIVKVLGRNVPIAVLSRKLREMWRPRGAMTVMDLPRQFFMVRFEEEDEYLSALTGGPWKAFGSYLMVQAWSPGFEPTRDDIVTTPVWVRLSNIPVNFYHKTILMGIAKGLGKPLRVDATTLNFERARFARVCVEVNLAKPLKGSVMINGERYYVAYEGLTNICSHCGIYGHLVHNCPTTAPVQGVLPEPQNVTEQQRVPERQSEPVKENDGFTVVRRSGRKSGSSRAGAGIGGSGEELGRNLREIPRIAEMGNIMLSNSFGRLQEDLMPPKSREGIFPMEENKENENTVEIQKNGKQILSAYKGIFERGASKAKHGETKGTRDKQAGQYKAISNNRPKANFKQNRPTRGLVFGPSSNEVVLSNSGKRLRLERTNVGRAGGIFTTESSVSKSLEGSIQSSGNISNPAQAVIEEHQTLIEQDEPEGSSNETMELVAV